MHPALLAVVIVIVGACGAVLTVLLYRLLAGPRRHTRAPAACRAAAFGRTRPIELVDHDRLATLLRPPRPT